MPGMPAAPESGTTQRALASIVWPACARLRWPRLVQVPLSAVPTREEPGSPLRQGATTVFDSAPRPSMATTTSSPTVSGPTPEGVPVAMTSPCSRVMTRLMASMS